MKAVSSVFTVTHHHIKADGKMPCERLGTERSLGSLRRCITRTLPRTLARWTISGMPEAGSGMASDEHNIGTSAGVRRCRSIWRRERRGGRQGRWTSLSVGSHSSDRCEEHAAGGVYVTLDRQIKHVGTKGCPACFGHQSAQRGVP